MPAKSDKHLCKGMNSYKGDAGCEAPVKKGAQDLGRFRLPFGVTGQPVIPKAVESTRDVEAWTQCRCGRMVTRAGAQLRRGDALTVRTAARSM